MHIMMRLQLVSPPPWYRMCSFLISRTLNSVANWIIGSYSSSSLRNKAWQFILHVHNTLTDFIEIAERGQTLCQSFRFQAFTMVIMINSSFWVITQRFAFVGRHFETPLVPPSGSIILIHPEDGPNQGFQKLAYKCKMQGNNPKTTIYQCQRIYLKCFSSQD